MQEGWKLTDWRNHTVIFTIERLAKYKKAAQTRVQAAFMII